MRCYAEKANTEYEKFVKSREVAYFEKAREYMYHPEVAETHFTKNVFMTICVFKVKRSVEKAGTLLESKSIVCVIDLIENELSDVDMQSYLLQIN